MPELKLTRHWAIVKTPCEWLLCDFSHERLLWFSLAPENALALASLDGRTSRQDIAAQLATTFKLREPLARVIVDETFSRFRHCLVAAGDGPPEPPRLLDWPEGLGLGRLGLARGAAPAQISLILTDQCNRACRYCYMNAKHVETPADGLDIARLAALADEAATLAVQSFVLTGGEPMLFPESVDLVNVLLERGFDVRVTTKNRFDLDRLTKVNRHNLHLEFSLDSLDPVQVSHFTGSDSAFADAMALLEGLRGSGIPFIIKMVVGRPNLSAVRPLIGFAKSCGAAALNIIEYEPSFGRKDDHLLLTDAERAALRAGAIALAEEVGQKVEPILRDGIGTDYRWQPAPGRDESTPGVYCDQGIRTLTVLPNGDVTCCISLPMYRQVRADNVFERGIYAVWNESSAYLGLANPGRDSMAGTSCETCDDFEYCNWTGRCQMKTLQWYGGMIGPDRECARYVENRTAR
ncbi:MAG: radical SAM protein [Rhodoplanes sp.]|uniref:radical SAM protein n=1 Tax=Rhodoplanes sp. TaxID=1968906 RepID=UPI00182B1E60|nr:radical SAM protein [Rhodoplanes sp.]NVO15947.1 radical SAM protein [Rhodoplanes sp.]